MTAVPTSPKWSMPNGPLKTVTFTDECGHRREFGVHLCRRRDGWDATGWWAWENGGEPTFLGRTLPIARDEFLLRVVHSWRPAFGYVDHDATRPIYGRGDERRERAELLAELKTTRKAS